MPTDVVMPQMGESIFEGTITKWLKKPGDRVQRDEPLFEISTDKVDAEIPSPASGVLKEVRANEGDTVQVNAVVGVIDSDGAGVQQQTSSAKTAAPAPTSAPAQPEPPARQTKQAGAAQPQAPPPQPERAPGQANPPADGGAVTEVVMPQMGESIFEGTITRWMKKPGERVQRDEPLFEISTDKVDAEIPAPVSGVLREIRVPEGQTVQVNSVVATIAAQGAAPAKAVPAPHPTEIKKPAPTAMPPTPQPEAQTTPEVRGRAEGKPAEIEVAETERIRSSPLVRKLAREHGVDLRQVSGTGLSGRITKDDIERFIAQQKGAPAAAAQPPAQPAARPTAPAAPPATGAVEIPGELVPMTPMRKKIAERMVESVRTSAHVHSVYQVDITRVVSLREREKRSFEQRTGTRLTFTTFFVRAAVEALRKFPIVNASVEGDKIHYHRNLNIGIAVSLDWGLIVPVIKNAEEKNFLGLQRVIIDLADRARNKKLAPDDVQGGTFTITNPGSFGQLFGLPIILQPQVAILGIGSIKKQPVVSSAADGTDSIAIRSICHISLGYDHRIIDGAVADQFLREVAQYLENWNEPLG